MRDFGRRTKKERRRLRKWVCELKSSRPNQFSHHSFDRLVICPVEFVILRFSSITLRIAYFFTISQITLDLFWMMRLLPYTWLKAHSFMVIERMKNENVMKVSGKGGIVFGFTPSHFIPLPPIHFISILPFPFSSLFSSNRISPWKARAVSIYLPIFILFSHFNIHLCQIINLPSELCWI